MGCYIHSFNECTFNIYILWMWIYFVWTSCRVENHTWSSLHNRVGHCNYYNENRWSCHVMKLFLGFYRIKMIVIMSCMMWLHFGFICLFFIDVLLKREMQMQMKLFLFLVTCEQEIILHIIFNSLNLFLIFLNSLSNIYENLRQVLAWSFF